jgi:FkbM family methyltransferase
MTNRIFKKLKKEWGRILRQKRRTEKKSIDGLKLQSVDLKFTNIESNDSKIAQHFEEDNPSQLLEGYLIPDLTISVCTATDINIWQHTSRNLLRLVPSKYYMVVVPDADVLLFKSITDKKINVVPESIYIGKLKHQLMNRLPRLKQWRAGWYLQQFVKFSVLKEARANENYLIWDSDAIPLKNCHFFRSTGEVEFYTGTEAHHPYFDFTQKLLGVGKVAPYSFIAQCLPCKGSWAQKFFAFIEERCQDNYVDAILDRIEFEEISGFSEYETIGTFLYTQFSEQIKIKNHLWLRNGKGLIGNPTNINRTPYKQLLNEYDHVAFERWEEPFSILKKQNDDFKKRFLEIELSTKNDLDKFLDELFLSHKVRTVIQIGANDGVQNDPLRKYLSSPGGYQATLVEPIPYYVDILKSLYMDRDDVQVLQVAAGATESVRELFFIPPTLASEMNGDGPQNNWAHGQGSFDKNTVIHWIKENSFRGKDYVAKLQDYISAITSIQLHTMRTERLLPLDRNGLLLVVDVQGFEIDVLNGIDWNNPPQWIIVEDDVGNTIDLLEFFADKGFSWVAGDHDKLFVRD